MYIVKAEYEYLLRVFVVVQPFFARPRFDGHNTKRPALFRPMND